MPLHKKTELPRLLVIQRVSLSHSTLKSRSIGARFGPLLTYMHRHKILRSDEVLESELRLSDLKEYDAVLFNKHTSQRGIEIIRAAKDLGITTIYDLDDWILDLPEYSVTDLGSDTLGNIVTMLHEADLITVSNPKLAYKLKHLRNDTVYLPNGFDHGALGHELNCETESRSPKVLFSNTDGIKLISHRQTFFADLRYFLEKHPDVIFDFRGDYFPELSQIPRVVKHAFLDNFVYKKAVRDAGYWFAIVPLGGQEDAATYEFNCCKSPIKYIDYGSLGVAGIYSNTPVYADVVAQGVTGLLAQNSGHNWFDSMNELLLNKTLRYEIKQAAYTDCLERFGLSSVSKILITLVCKDK